MTKEDKKIREQLITKKQERQHRERLLLAIQSGTPPQNPPPESRASWWQTIRNLRVWAWGKIGGVSTLLGLLGLLALYPRMSVKGLDTFDPDNPTSVRITISNDSLYPLREVRYYCVQIKGDTGRPQDKIESNTTYPRDIEIGNLAINDPKTVSCEVIDAAMAVLGMAPFVTTVDFMLVVPFRPIVLSARARDFISYFIPSFTLYCCERNFRFTAEGDKNGRFHVLPQPQVPVPKMEPWGKK